MEFLAQFDSDIMYIKGETNLVADILSRYYESDLWDKHQSVVQYVNVDTQLDPDREDLPWDRFEENCAMSTVHIEFNVTRCPKRQWHTPM
jgi:hypothetical protein